MSDQAAARRVAILGASADRHKFGNISVRAHRDHGWTVFPVNPRGGEIEGLHVYVRLADVPQPLDRISVYLPPDRLRPLLPEIAAAGARDVFFNPGADAPAVLAEAKVLGINVVAACSIVAIGASPADY